MIHLIDTFNGRTVSRHYSLAAAVAANRRLQRRLTGGSYLPTTYAVDCATGDGIRIGPNTYLGVGRLRPLTSAEAVEAAEAGERLAWPR